MSNPEYPYRTTYRIVKCEGCGRLFRIYRFPSYNGDPNYCPECNRKSGEPYSHKSNVIYVYFGGRSKPRWQLN